MPRHRITANKTIFSLLDHFCASRGLSLSNVSQPRWITSDRSHRYFMTHAVVSSFISFSAGRKIARLDLATRSYVVTVGFENSSGIAGIAELPLDPAFLTVVLAELTPRPVASTDNIRNIVEFSDLTSNAEYDGHDRDLIASLFPKIHVYETQSYPSPATWNLFFRMCIDESDLGGFSWIDGDLAETLRVVCDLDPERIPYRVLCRSVFDGDRSTFFLALYRCLEAIYSYSSAQALVETLGISQEWGIVAAALEDKLGWHPREEGSLTSLLAKAAAPDDLRLALRAMGENDEGEGIELVNRASKRIYWLRNAIVHYRPAHHSVSLDSFDWAKLCTALAGLVIHVYGSVFQA